MASAGIDSNTISLLHFDGSYTDVGSSPHTWSVVNGAPTLPTSGQKFGSNCVSFNGSSAIQTPNHADFQTGAGDFTIDTWFSADVSGVNTIRAMCGMCTSTGSERSHSLWLTGANFLRFTYFDTGERVCIGATPITAAGMHHAAAVKFGSNIMLFLDGVQQGTSTAVTAMKTPTDPFTIGRTGSYVTAQWWIGQIDEFRFSKVARWTTNFTPPALPYSTGRALKVWNGSAWVEKSKKVWNGSAWVAKPVKVWNGSAWV